MESAKRLVRAVFAPEGNAPAPPEELRDLLARMKGEVATRGMDEEQIAAVGALKLVLLPSIIAILFTDLFDSLSTFIGVSSGKNCASSIASTSNLLRCTIFQKLSSSWIITAES